MVVPVGAVASLLSYDEIKNKLPWLPRLIDRSPRLEALIQTTLPTLAVVTFNGLSPFLLECAYIDYHRGKADGQGYRISKLIPRGQLPSTPYSGSEIPPHVPFAKLMSGTTSCSSSTCSSCSCSRALTGSSLAMRR